MDWLVLAFFVLVPPILFGLTFLWAWTRWRPKSKPRPVFVYVASFAVWLGIIMLLLVLTSRNATQYMMVRSMLAFPWPPPLASAETTIPRNWLPASAVTRLADVAEKIEHALGKAGYPRWSYSSVPNGFALVSQMEQIKSDGTPSPGPARWSTDMPRVINLTLLEFIKALANAQPGYYRVIVFIVTNAYSAESGRRFRANPATRRSPATQASGLGLQWPTSVCFG